MVHGSTKACAGGPIQEPITIPSNDGNVNINNATNNCSIDTSADQLSNSNHQSNKASNDHSTIKYDFLEES